MKVQWLPRCRRAEDPPALFDLLGDDRTVIEQAGEPLGAPRWRASRARPLVPEFRVALWHVDSGTLAIVGGEGNVVHALVDDPCAGWPERRPPDHGGRPRPFDPPTTSGVAHLPGTDAPRPDLSPTPTGLFRLDVWALGRDPGSACGVSSLGWVGHGQASTAIRPPRRRRAAGPG